MSIKYKYKNEKARLDIIIQNQGKPCIENKKEKYIEYCEEDEKIENNKIIKNENYINELKEQKIKKINNEVYNQIISSYPETKQLNILRDCIKNNENIKKSDELNKMDEFVEKIRTEAKNKKDKIKQAMTEKEIEAVDIKFKEEPTKKENTTEENIIENNDNIEIIQKEIKTTTKKKTTTTNKETI